MNRLLTQGGLAVLALLASIASSAEEEIYSKPTANQYPLNVYWGDTHLHTGMSFDAGSFGCRLGPEDAFRFARGGKGNRFNTVLQCPIPGAILEPSYPGKLRISLPRPNWPLTTLAHPRASHRTHPKRPPCPDPMQRG